ncbi:MAG: hypothetical protein IIC31_08760 [Chloroflexi bacterium]|nr:hypothetical protein [Chloroflexota bacterium]
MDWGFIFQVTLAVLGVALMVGGIVAYRGSVGTGVRSFAAAGIASGVVMLAIVVMTVLRTAPATDPRSLGMYRGTQLDRPNRRYSS